MAKILITVIWLCFYIVFFNDVVAATQPTERYQLTIEKSYEGSVIGANTAAGGVTCGTGAYGQNNGVFSDDNDCSSTYQDGTLLEFELRPIAGYETEWLFEKSCANTRISTNGNNFTVLVKENCTITPVFVPTSNKLKLCPEIKIDRDIDSYECVKGKNKFTATEDIYALAEVVGLSNGSHQFKYVFTNEALVITEVDNDSVNFDDDHWYYLWTSFESKRAGTWKVEFYIDDVKFKESIFTIGDSIEEVPSLYGTSFRGGRVGGELYAGDALGTGAVWNNIADRYITTAQCRYRKYNSNDEWIYINLNPSSTNNEGGSTTSSFESDDFVIKNEGTYSFQYRASSSLSLSGNPVSTSEWKESNQVIHAAVSGNGQCGTANNKVYPSSATGYGTDTQCAVGTSNNTSFPEPSGTAGKVTWECSTNTGGASCSATRERSTVVEICGSANNKQYPSSATSYGSDTLCINGSEPKFSFADFPEKGATTEWVCLGVNGADDKTCSASRGSDVVVTPTPINGQCGTANNKTYSSGATSYGSDTQCSVGSVSSGLFPVEGGTQNWLCSGFNGGSSTNCSANREEGDDGLVSLTLSVKGKGFIGSSEFGISCSDQCTYQVPPNATLGLYANGDPEWEFNRWDGTNCSSSRCKISIADFASTTTLARQKNSNLLSRVNTSGNIFITAVFDEVDLNSASDQSRLIDFSPKSVSRGEETVFTLTGENLPKNIIGNIQGTRGYCSLESYSPTLIKVKCLASTTGKKRFYLKEATNGGKITIEGGQDFHVQVVSSKNKNPRVWGHVPKISFEGKRLTVTAKSYDADANLKSIQVNWNGIWKKITQVSNKQGQDISFSYTSNSTGTLNVKFRAIDDDGGSSISKTYKILIKPIKKKTTEDPVTGVDGADETKDKNPEKSCTVEIIGNPIVPANGSKVEFRRLLTVQGLIPVSFDIRYNSLVRDNGVIGIGWSLANAHAAYIFEDADGNVHVVWSKNSEHIFLKNTDGSYKPSSYGCRLDRLTKWTDGTFRIKRHDGSVYTFDEFNFLSEIKNHRGQSTYFDYNAKGQIEKAEEPISGFYIQYKYNGNDKLIEAKNSAGSHVSLSYKDDLLMSITHADGVKEGFTYNDLNQLSSRSVNGLVTTKTQYDSLGRAFEQEDTNENNKPITLEYNETDTEISVVLNNRDGSKKTQYFNKDYEITHEVDEMGNVISYGYNNLGKLETLTDGKGYTTSFKYNEKGDVTHIISPDGTLVVKEYDANRNIIKITDQLGAVEQYEYDSNNNITKKTNKLGHIIRYEYNKNAQIEKITSPEGRVSSFAYSNGLLSKIYDHDGNYRELEYNQAGYLVSDSDFLGNKTRYEVDPLGRILSETDPFGNKKSISYDAQGNVTKTVDFNGNKTTFIYDSENNVTQKTKHLGDGKEIIWKYTYDGESRLVSTIDPNANITTIKRDKLGRVVSIIDANGNTFQITYDANGNITQTLDALGNSSQLSYDEKNQLLQSKDALNKVYQFKYDKLGRLKSSKDPLGRIFFNIYDAKSRLLKTVNPIGIEAKQSFDKDNHVISVEDPQKNKRDIVVNNKGVVTDETTADNVKNTYQYNKNGSVLEGVDSRGNAYFYQYDAKSQLIQFKDSVSVIDYSYDNNGNLLSVIDQQGETKRTYDALNRLVQYTTNKQSIGYEYDNNSNLTKLSYPSTDTQKLDIQQSYDKTNRLLSVSKFDSNENLISYEYNKNNQVILARRANGTYIEYVYDSLGRVTQLSDKFADGSDLMTYNIRYDDLGRITSEVSTPSYPPSPELIKQTSMVYGASNRLIEKDGKSFDFDADGNILEAEGKQLTFNSRNQLIASGEYRYKYNAEGHRTEINSSKTSIQYLTNPNTLGLPNLIRQIKDMKIQDYIYGNGLVAQYDHANKQYYFFHYDIRGSVIAVSNSEGKVVARYGYLPYGKQYSVLGNIDTPFGYNGRDGVLVDLSGLYFMRARYYSPSLKRFVNKDPLKGNVSNQPSLNRYSYVGGDPINKVDPSGLCEDPILIGAGFTDGGEGTCYGEGGSNVLNGVRVSIIGEMLFPSDEVESTIKYACQKSKGDCLIVKASFVTMEACYGAIEVLGIEAGVGLIAKGVSKATASVYKIFHVSKIGQASLIKEAIINSSNTLWKTRSFKGIRVYQRDDLIQPYVLDAMGRTNIQRMKKGLAPIGPDGKSINLHHTLQSSDSPIAEITQTFHSKNTKTIHINATSVPSGIDRNAFNKWRKAYWINRSLDF